MKPKNYIHKFYKDASWSRSVMNKIMPKQNTSIQNNFWIIQVVAKGKCWSLCIQKKNIFLQYFLMVELMREQQNTTQS